MALVPAVLTLNVSPCSFSVAVDRKKLARPGWVARHERMSVAVNHEHP